MKQLKKRNIIIGGAALAAFLALAWLAIPRASISPADATNDIPVSQAISISSSPLASIGKFAVYSGDQPLAVEYNLDSGDLVRDFNLQPGEEIRVEAKVTSFLGVMREFSATFRTVEPLLITGVTADGGPVEAGQEIPPQANIEFSFNKQLANATISIDKAPAIDMSVDSQDPTRALMPSIVTLKQGVVHTFGISASAGDSSTLGQEIQAPVLSPLAVYGTARSENDSLVVELDSSVAFRDPAAVRAALTTDLPGAGIDVESQKIIITCASPDASRKYAISLGRAEGADGSFLEAPLAMTLAMQISGAGPVIESGSASYGGYSYTPGTPQSRESSGAGGGPPPGWPPCCPWPPT